MPAVLAAPQSDVDQVIYDSGLGDSRGFVSDGAYIGRPALGPSATDQVKPTMEPQEAYTAALLSRFLRTRELMRSDPRIELLAGLNRDHPTKFSTSDNKGYAQWMRMLQTTAPLPAQVQAMSQTSAFRLLKFAQRMLLTRGKDVTAITSTWIWSLLARLDDVGTMNNDQACAVREFGKRAVLVQLSFNDPIAAHQLEKIDGGDDSLPNECPESDGQPATPNDAEIDLFAVETDKKDTNEDSVARQNTLATLDMIILVVGELFGQKDLIDFRQRWSAFEASNCRDEVQDAR